MNKSVGELELPEGVLLMRFAHLHGVAVPFEEKARPAASPVSASAPLQQPNRPGAARHRALDDFFADLERTLGDIAPPSQS